MPPLHTRPLFTGRLGANTGLSSRYPHRPMITSYLIPPFGADVSPLLFMYLYTQAFLSSPLPASQTIHCCFLMPGLSAPDRKTDDKPESRSRTMVRTLKMSPSGFMSGVSCRQCSTDLFLPDRWVCCCWRQGAPGRETDESTIVACVIKLPFLHMHLHGWPDRFFAASNSRQSHGSR